MVAAVYRDAVSVLSPWRLDRRSCRSSLPVGMGVGARGRHAAPRPGPRFQGHHFTLAEPPKVGQNTLLGNLTASHALQERDQSA